MCNINLCIRKDRKLTSLPSLWMNTASWQSYQRNPHGEGMIGFRNKGVVVRKGLDKLIFHAKYWMLATHQRLATSGKKDKTNAHPIVTDSLVLMHNGIIDGMGNHEYSDSFEYAQRLEQIYVSNDHDLVKAIRTMHKKLEGYYSIVVYEKGTGKVYYYKNHMATISVMQNDKYLFLSTSRENVEYARVLTMGLQTVDVENGAIYDVTDGFSKVGEIEKPLQKTMAREQYDNFAGYSYRRWGEYIG